MVDHVSRDLVEIALGRVSGDDFEKFANAFFSTMLGVNYVPLGGMHDGGADAYALEHLSTRSQSVDQFFQVTVEKDVKSKTRRTIAALKKNGRSVRALTLVTSQAVSKPDLVESELLGELDVIVQIREREYLLSHVNDSSALRGHFSEHLWKYTNFLNALGASALPTHAIHVTDPTVFVFLRQEVDRTGGNGHLITQIAESTVLWALQGTDPDRDVKMSAQEVLEKVTEVIPSAPSILSADLLQKTLQDLSQKSQLGGRRVNWHRSENAFVLPYATREALAAESDADESLSLHISERLAARAAELDSADTKGLTTASIAAVSLKALQIAFEHRGLEFASFVTTEAAQTDIPQMTDSVREAVIASRIGPALMQSMMSAALNVVRDCLYSGDEREREYLRRLAKTYTILFLLRQDPKVVSYFEEMNAHYYLYVGSDLLVRSLSERLLPPENQAVSNLLRMCQNAGATLVLSDPVLDEVAGNLRAADLEFKNYYKPIEHRLTPEMMREISKILVRAYLYNRHKDGAPQNWPAFVNLFCDYSKLRQPAAIQQLRRYFQASYGMVHVTRDELMKDIDPATLSQLTEALLAPKGHHDLAANDALMVLSVYARRESEDERQTVTAFGHHTWWLTNETMVLRQTGELVRARGGSGYMMRPDFLLNFLALAPQLSEVRQTFKNVFPSALGVELSRRMRPDAVHKLMKELAAAEQLDEARRLVVMATCADSIKTDLGKRFERVLPSTASTRDVDAARGGRRRGSQRSEDARRGQSEARS